MAGKPGRKRRAGGSPAKGKGTPAAKGGRSRGTQRLALVLFAAVFVVLFVVFAVAQGLGAPSVPSGDVAKVSSLPSGEDTISEAEVKRAVGQQIVAKAEKKAPKPGSKKYEEFKEAALGELLDQKWIQGEAEELGITVTPKQIETELATIKKQNFPTAKSYEEFLKKSHFTQADVDSRVKLQVLSNEIKERVENESGAPTESELKAYYEQEKATQFTTKASRDVRVIVNKDKKQVEAAQKLLEADQSEKSWKAVAKKYSSDPSTKNNGGLQKAISEEFVTGPLRKAIFESATGELVGPVDFEKNFLLLEVVKLNPAKVQKFSEVKSQISQTLTQQNQQEFFSEFVSDYQSKWTSRTVCASGWTIERCSNFKSSGHPSTASAACYEAEPKTPAKECPAPVVQNTPALPGTTTTTKPQGERLVQRPHPEGSGETSSQSLPLEATPQGGATEAAPEAAE